MNSVVISGNVTKDPAISTSANGTKFARFTVAINHRSRKDADAPSTADFIPCTAFNSQAEFAEKYIKTGTGLIIRGHLSTGSYNDRDGNRRYTWEVIVDEMEFKERKASDSANTAAGSGHNAPARQPAPGYTPASGGYAPQGGYGAQAPGYAPQGGGYGAPAPGYGQQGGYGAPAPNVNPAPAPAPDGFMQIPDGDEDSLPFN